ncbi:MAG: site-specific DNA-methyltransferase [Bacteroidetes bacterium]|nr:site-specific DNA-methyltransferase [Bacteroidota bacterium]MBU1677911.1 site-specific DNA-methyltransferase [Bacteroidota bacterium]
MAKQKKKSAKKNSHLPTVASAKAGKPIEQYDHKDKKRLNNPPVGLVDAHTDPANDGSGLKKKKYAYDPHLDPQLQWAGKTEHTSFEVNTVSLHVHERIDPRRIIEQLKKEPDSQLSLFQTNTETKGLSKAIEFYKHKENWSNRLIAGDSLLVMNSLLQKENMGGKVQMIYFDPPYGIKYSSNFQPFIDKSSTPAQDKDEDLTTEPEMLKAFRDTWELGIHSYLTYIRDRLKLAYDLLDDTGSVFVQISDENVHLIRNMMDEVFGVQNFVSQVSIKRASVMFAKKLLNNAVFYVVWYAKDKEKIKYNQLFFERDEQWFADSAGSHLRAESADGKKSKSLTGDERKNMKLFMLENKGWRLYRLLGVNAQGTEKQDGFEFKGQTFYPPKGTQWKYSYEGLEKLKKEKRFEIEKNSLSVKVYLDDYPVVSINSLWEQIGPAADKIYVVQTSDEIVKRCMLMTTMPGELTLDITCGSGTTAYVAEQYGRRWITCDTSRIALTLAKQRLMSANFDYYELAYPNEGVGSGFKYKTVLHRTLGTIANNEPAPTEILINQPETDSKRQRITGPFTVEAVPAPVVKAMDDALTSLSMTDGEADNSVSRSGETLRQNNWIDELKNTGVRGKSGNRIEFTRMETARGLRYVQAEGETKEAKPKKVYVVFAPEHAPLEQRTVELAWEEVKPYKPDIILFCALQFDEEAAKDIDEMNPEITKCQFLKAQMNADLLTDDLKKKRSSNESFWLIGQPDLRMNEIKSGEHKGKYQVEVHGFDYYNPKTGTVDSGGKGDIAMWMLDTDYDGRSLFPSQVFFPMAGVKEGWTKLTKNLKAEIDEEKIEVFKGTVSLPFTPGKAVAIKIIDARGIESLKIIRM